jgi:hypothetical protein
VRPLRCLKAHQQVVAGGDWFLLSKAEPVIGRHRLTGRVLGSIARDAFPDEDLEIVWRRERCTCHKVYDLLVFLRWARMESIAMPSPDICVGMDVYRSGVGLPLTTKKVGDPEGRLPGLRA